MKVEEQQKRLAEQLKKANSVLSYLRKQENTHYQQYDKPKDVEELLEVKDLSLFHVEEITFEEKAPRREAMENILGTMGNMEGYNFIYIIQGNPQGVKFYLGVVKDYSVDDSRRRFKNSSDVGKFILQPAIQGNFRGCTLHALDNDEEKSIIDFLSKHRYGGILEGVPTIDEKRENFQGVERLVDVMLAGGEEFGLVIISKPLPDSDINHIESSLNAVSDALSPLSKYTIQYNDSFGKNTQDSFNRNWNKSSNRGNTKSVSEAKSRNHQRSRDNRVDESNNIQVTGMTSATNNWAVHRTTSEGDRHSSGSSNVNETSNNSSDSHELTYSSSEQGTQVYSNNGSNARSTNKSTSVNKSVNDSVSKNVGVSYGRSKVKTSVTNESDNTSIIHTMEIDKKSAGEWCKYIDENLLPRLDNGRGKGVFVSCAYVIGSKPATLYRMANTLISLYSGQKGNKSQLIFHEFEKPNESSCCQKLRNLQLPYSEMEQRDVLSNVVSRFVDERGYAFAGHWLTANELSVLAGMPQKEVIGLSLREEVEFGLNIRNTPAEQDRIYLGNMVQCGQEQKNLPVYLDRNILNMHTFITGVTGSGKTTTCQNILLDCDMPFMVIEPAKTEYRVLKDRCDDIIYFTPGRNDVAPFFLNPFELFPGEAISSRVDMIKATFEASFEMEAAIPQIMEAAVYRIYENKGWNIATNTWRGKKSNDSDGPFAKGVYAFPTLEDMKDVIDTVVQEQNFDDRLKNDYIGSIKARLLGLLVGAKGMMFNTRRSVDFRDLVKRKVVIELEEIKNGNEKSLIMGFIMTNMIQAVKAEHIAASREGKEFRHITLVEEAHRLLARYTPGDSNNKKQGVEIFADMLAEVRKYGESMVIVDQIPDKMTPEVLKNTNTKIVHKIFAQDDKDAIGSTMALSKEQKEFLSNLVAGRAVVFTQGWQKAVQVQIFQKESTTGYKEIEEGEIRKIALKYYLDNYKIGILPGLECVDLDRSLTTDDVDAYLQMMSEYDFFTEIQKINEIEGKGISTEDDVQEFVKKIRKAGYEKGKEFVKQYILYLRKNVSDTDLYDDSKCEKLLNLLSDILDTDKSFSRNFVKMKFA